MASSGRGGERDSCARRRHSRRRGDGTVQAILNEIDGFDHSGKNHVGVPAIFGMNFQTVSTAQKLPTSDGLTGGYLTGGTIPGPLLVRALNTIGATVETTQIAPTILALLGLNPYELQAVRIEHTQVLPGLRIHTGF